MIAKAIPRKKGQSSDYKRLAQYITRGDALGERIEPHRITNCVALDGVEAVTEILLTQELAQKKNSRSVGDKTYHLVVSFPPGEKPTPEQLVRIEDELVASIGYAEHQRLSAIHTDTECLHLHIAINKVHPFTYRTHRPSFDKQALQETCVRLETEFELERTNHGRAAERTRTTYEQEHIANERRRLARDARNQAILRESYDLALASEQAPETLSRVRTLSSVGVVRPNRRTGVLLPDHEAQDLDGKRANADHDVRWQRASDRGHADQAGEAGLSPAAMPAAAKAMEIHGGVESFITRAREAVVATNLAGDPPASWQDLHARLAKQGLQLQQRGAGLILVDDQGGYAKASTVARTLTQGALSKQLGPWEAPKVVMAKARPERPVQRGDAAKALFAAYSADKTAAEIRRKQDRDAAFKWQLAELARIRDERDARRAGVRASRHLKPSKKVLEYSLISRDAALAERAIRKEGQKRRRQILDATPLPTWQTWLSAKALAGDPVALATMRDRQDRADRRTRAALTAKDSAEAHLIAHRNAERRLLRDGTVAYDPGDGGRVFDAADGVQLRGTGAAAAFLALELASERYKGQALRVTGDANLQRSLADLAALKGLSVTFEDPNLEARRLAKSRPQGAKEIVDKVIDPANDRGIER